VLRPKARSRRPAGGGAPTLRPEQVGRNVGEHRPHARRPCHLGPPNRSAHPRLRLTSTAQLRIQPRLSLPASAGLAPKARHAIGKKQTAAGLDQPGGYLNNVVGEQTYVAGKTKHIAGVIAEATGSPSSSPRPPATCPRGWRCPFSAPSRSERHSTRRGCPRSHPPGPTTSVPTRPISRSNSGTAPTTTAAGRDISSRSCTRSAGTESRT